MQAIWILAFARMTIGVLRYFGALSASNKEGPLLPREQEAFLSSRRRV